MRRVPSRELLDDDAGTESEVADALEDLNSINRRLGGMATTLHMITRVAARSGKSNLSLLEVAAGSGNLPRSVSSRIQRRGIDLRVTLLDRCATHMFAGGNKVVADALALPFRDNAFDVVGCSLFVHHLSPGQVQEFVQEALRCSRIAVLINDLVRHPLHFLAACAGRFMYRSRLTRNDAPTSVRQAYTPDELRKILYRSGAASIEIKRHYFYRMGAIVWKTKYTI